MKRTAACRWWKKARRVPRATRARRHRAERQSSTEWKAKASRFARPSCPCPKLCLLFRYRNNKHKPLPGAQLRYFVHAADGRPLALLGFGAAAWKTAPRDRFIGWDPATRQRNLPLVVNHARYLILP